MAGYVTTREFRYPGKPRRGDAVAVLSPSSGLAARFPRPYELGLHRLWQEFGLNPAVFPTTTAAAASPAERAADVMAAFIEPEIKAVIATIGGEDELKVLAHLDPEVLAANPKPFFGYSDNTNLHLYLWRLGLVSYIGGSVMVQFGWPVAMEPTSRLSLQRALLQRGSYRLEPPDRYTDEEGDWDDPATLETAPPSFPAVDDLNLTVRHLCKVDLKVHFKVVTSAIPRPPNARRQSPEAYFVTSLMEMLSASAA